jgi:hypothetical protein
LKLIKVRFTSWRDQSVAPRTTAFQRQLDRWITRLSALSVAAAGLHDRAEWPDNKELKMQADAIRAEVQKIDFERHVLLAAEGAVATLEAREARKHTRVGTFGYKVLTDTSTQIGYFVDEAGHDLPALAVFTYDVVDADPAAPGWANYERRGPS